MRVVNSYRAPIGAQPLGIPPLKKCYQTRAVKRYAMRFRSVLIAAALLSSCERKAATPDPEKPIEPTFSEVGAADAFGAPGGDVNDVAFWSHPDVAFESLVLTVNDAVVEAFAVETGRLVFSVPGGADTIEVFYAGEKSPGFFIAASGGAYRLFAIAGDGRSAASQGLFEAASEMALFCVKGGVEPVLYEIAGGTISSRALTIAANAAELASPETLVESGNAVACHVDPFRDDVIVISSDGAIRRINPASGAVFGIALPAELSAGASSLAVGRTEAGEPSVQVALLDERTGSISLFDASDGHALGRIRVKATFDLEAVTSASRIDIGSANFGGVYRDGALAVVTSGAGAPVRLVPWNGVMSALSLRVPAALNPRSPKIEPEDDDVISIEVIEP